MINTLIYSQNSQPIQDVGISPCSSFPSSPYVVIQDSCQNFGSPLSQTTSRDSSPSVSSTREMTESQSSQCFITVQGILPPSKNAQGRYECHLCERSYTHAKHLKRHMMRHTGQKPYECPWCPSRFTRPDIRKRHVAKCKVRRKVEGLDSIKIEQEDPAKMISLRNKKLRAKKAAAAAAAATEKSTSSTSPAPANIPSEASTPVTNTFPLHPLTPSPTAGSATIRFEEAPSVYAPLPKPEHQGQEFCQDASTSYQIKPMPIGMPATPNIIYDNNSSISTTPIEYQQLQYPVYNSQYDMPTQFDANCQFVQYAQPLISAPQAFYPQDYMYNFNPMETFVSPIYQ